MWGPDTSVADIFDAVEAAIHDAELVPQVDVYADVDATTHDAELLSEVAIIAFLTLFHSGRLRARWPTWSCDNL